MDSSDDSDLDEFLKNISKPIVNADSFLKNHGFNLIKEICRNSSPDSSQTKGISTPRNDIEKSIIDLENKLFGNESDLSSTKDEMLENLAKSVENELCKEDSRPLATLLRDKTSLFDEYIPLPGGSKDLEHGIDPVYRDCLQFLSNRLQSIPVSSPVSEDASGSKKHFIPEEKDQNYLTVLQLAGVFAGTAGLPNKSEECEESSIQDSEKVDQNIEDTDKNNEQSVSSEETKEVKNSKKKKNQKDNEYVPKKIPITWIDPRSDPDFADELSEIMQCDAFDYEQGNCKMEPHVDDLAEETLPPYLPRDLVKMLTSGSMKDFEDWEYSIKVEKGENSESEDSEKEELINSVRAFKKEILKNKKLEEKPPNFQDLKIEKVGGKLDMSEFMTVTMPPNVEELIGVRNDVGEVITYEAVKRSSEHISKEYERTYMGIPSDTSDEEEDKEKKDDEVDDDIDWDKDVVKESKITEGVDESLTEEELTRNVNHIKRIVDVVRNKPMVQFDSKLEEQMQAVNTFLDKIGIPKAGEIQGESIDELMKEESKMFEHILKVHEDKVCPPGISEVDITTDDEDDEYFKETSKLLKDIDDEAETISRPAHLPVNFPGASDSESEEVNDDQPSTGLEVASNERKLFDDDELEEESDENDEILELSSDENSSSEEDSEEDISEGEEAVLDEQFKKEYFERGGTVDGLGDVQEHEYNLELETLESYSEKFLTFPFISKHSGQYDFVRTRRVIAQAYPEFRAETFADLSKDLPELLKGSDMSKILEADSESTSEDDAGFNIESDPFELEEITQIATQADDVHHGFTTADEDEDSMHEPLSPVSVHRMNKDSTDETKIEGRKKILKKKRKRVSSSKCNSDSETEEEPDCSHETTLVWKPLNKFEEPNHETLDEAMSQLHKMLVKPLPKFRIPKGVKEWIKGEYTPSRETVRKWKQLYIDYFGSYTVLDRILPPEKVSCFEEVVQMFDDSVDLDDTEYNELLNFKKLLQEKKVLKEQKEKADEIISTGDALSQEGTSIEQNQQPIIKEESPAEQHQKEVNQEKPSANINQKETTVEIETTQKKMKNLSLSNDEPNSPGQEDETQVNEAKPPKVAVIHLRDVKPIPKKEEWAEEVNCNERNEMGVPPALSFPFQLDGFQRKAIQALENGYNVFVSAHTSAGKTVVAEYAIAMSKRNRSKAVYTSPVKALSNQKYADFKRIFDSVGLITGDIQLNENSECLIMTTEILRSMLYNSSEKIRDLEFVVFDEVHYINDPERGHVWEEVLILLPTQVQIVMLSATVPNTLEFANWVGRTKQRKVVVCATRHRPVPLNHYLYTGTGGPSPGDTYLLKSGDGNFNLNEYCKAEKAMKNAQERERVQKKIQATKRMEAEKQWKKSGQKGRPPGFSQEEVALVFFKKDQTMWIALISFLEKKDWLPAVVFVFSRKKCDNFAEMLTTIDLTTKSEKSYVHRFIKSQIEKLDEVDQDLPQIQVMKGQLARGIGVHHSGILPVMKEIVEVLFQEGKVKLLFATETFAMGVNMPARTVIFHSVKKFDGNETRLLLPAEYVQMAGRAGRRGKDLAGNVIILAKSTEVLPRTELETLLFGNPCKLISKFKVSYRMILNTLTVSGMLTVQNLMERSFCENHGQIKRTVLEKDLVDYEKAEKAMKKSMYKDVDNTVVEIMAKFYDNAIRFITDWNNLRVQMMIQSRTFKDLSPGRLLKICCRSLINRTALLLEFEQFPEDSSRNIYKVLVMNQNNEFERSIAPDGHEMTQEQLETWYRVISLTSGLPSEIEILSSPHDYSIITVKPINIIAVYKEVLKLPRNVFDDYISHLKRQMQSSRSRTNEAGDTVARYLYAFSGKGTELNERNISYDNFDLAIAVAQMWSILDEINKSPLSCNTPFVMQAFRKVYRWKLALSKVEKLRYDLSAENMTLYPDFRSKMELLKEKGYISKNEHVQMKGYMAARIGKYELIVCEMLVENVLVDLPAEEVAALLSFLVYQSSSEELPVDESLPPSLQKAILKCTKIMKDITELEKSYGIRDYDGSEISKLKFGLVPIMYAWAKQEPLKKIMEMPVEFDFQEGMLVRWIQQLLETLKEVEAAARLMGDPGVPSRLQAAGQSIKRGIVFAPSLYTTML